MKRLIKYISFFILFLITAISAVPFFIPLESVKKIASERVKDMTGRDLIIAGDVKASFWPNIGVKLQKVSLSNTEGYSSKNIAEIDELTAEVALLPLLNGEIKINQFIVNKPIINLEINKDGVANWRFFAAKTGEDTAKPATSNSLESNRSTPPIPALGNIKIIAGDFSYKNLRNGKSYSAKNVNLNIEMPHSDAPLDIALNMIWNKEKINFSLNLEQPAQLIYGKDSPVKTDIKIGSLLAVIFNGKANLQGTNGNLDIKIPSLITLAKFAGTKIDWKGDTYVSFNIDGALNCGLEECAVNKAKLELDKSVFNGNMKINFTNKIPAIEAKLVTDKFDLNHYLPKPEKQAALSLISDAQAAQNWDTKKIDLSILKAVNAKLALNIGELLYQATTLSKLTLNLQLANGALSLDIPNVGLYSGTAKISATATANNNFSCNLEASNIQIEPLLKDFVEFDRLTGTATINSSINASGASQQAIISSLAGKGNMQINDGTIRGIDLAKVVSSAKAMVTGVDTTSEKTKFSELGGTFIITQGIVKNEDLMMKAPLLRLKGTGTVDLPNKYVNYRLVPSLVATLQGQGGKDKTGLDIPVMVDGDFDKLKFTPDLGSVARDALKNPEKIKETVKDVKGTVKNLKESIKNPDDVKNLLKGFR